MFVKKLKLFTMFFIISILTGDINVYTHRHYDSDKILFQDFTNLTGIKVNVIKGSADQLIQRLQTEGENSPADILYLSDIINSEKAKAKNLTHKINDSELLFDNKFELLVSLLFKFTDPE